MVLPTKDASALENLLNDCTSATFGLGDKDVHELSSRRFGILDMIERTLLLSINSAQDNDLQFRRVRAELYKLNICHFLADLWSCTGWFCRYILVPPVSSVPMS